MRHQSNGVVGVNGRISLPAERADEASHRRSRRLEAFAPEQRSAIIAVGAGSPNREDLADSFPGLLFAIATGYGTHAARSGALAAIDEGRPLREAATRLGLPFWLRKLPAQAFQAPLPAVPSDPPLVDRLVSLIPPPAAAAAWLGRVLTAHHLGVPGLPAWVAKSYRGPTPSPHAETFLRTLAWAWFANRPGTRGAQLLGPRWTPSLGTRRALAETALWRDRIALDVCLGDGIADGWLADGTAHGLEFVALRTAEDFIAEAKAMDNCLDRYADRLQSDAVRVFSIRSDGRPVADVEIATHHRELGMPAITQLRAPHNRRAAADVWQATYAWLGSQQIRCAGDGMTLKATAAERRRRLERIWQPFLESLPEGARASYERAIMPAAKVARPGRRKTAPT